MSDSQPASTSKARAYIQSKGWNTKDAPDEHLRIEYCQYCKHDGYKMYVRCSGDKFDGLWDCKVCNETGNLDRLMRDCGDKAPEGVMSTKDWAASGKPPEAPPTNIDYMHQCLMQDEQALAYLVEERGLSLDTIEKYKLGVSTRFFPSIERKAKAIIYPYLMKDKCVFAKWRTLPPEQKAFDALHGHTAPLFNQQCLKPGMEELWVVEGEGDTLAMLNQGIENVIGVPGADAKKAAWIQLLDQVAPKRIYILYDSDKVGQEGAQKIAFRIGIEKCYNVTLPEFEKDDEKPGKDVTEWFKHGGTIAELDELKLLAKKFDVVGTCNMQSALDKLKVQIQTRGTLKPTFTCQWKACVAKGVGGERGDRIDIIAEEKRGKTTFALNWSDFLTTKEGGGFNGLFFCLEMPEERLARKWTSYVTHFDDSPPKSDEEAIQKSKDLLVAIDKAKDIALHERPGDLLFGSSKSDDPDEVIDTIRQCVRRYGLDFVVFDNLQMFADSTLKNLSHRTAHLSQLSKKLKKLATDLNIMLILIVQPNRVQEGKIVDANNADGASQIQKDCDAMIALHRNLKGNITAKDFEELGGFIDEEQAFDPQTLVKVSRSRYAGGGQTTIIFNGQYSEFVDYTPGTTLTQVAAAVAKNGIMGAVPQERVAAVFQNAQMVPQETVSA